MWSSVATKNSFAVALMEQGNYIESAQLLREVLAEIRDCCDETNRPAEAQKGCEESRAIASPLEIKPSDAAALSGELYQCAFQLSLTASYSAESAAIVIMYNIALSMHCEAMVKGSTSALCKVLKIYERCHQICGNIGADEMMRMIPLVASIIHNIGCIYNTFYQRDQARGYRYQLMQLLDTFSPCEVGMESYVFFQSSVFFDAGRAMQGAAAA